MSYSEWQDLHNDNAMDESNKDKIAVEIKIGNNVFYDCIVEIETFRNIPCETEVLSMTRIVTDVEGNEIDDLQMELDLHEFPHYVMEAAKKKALYMIG